MNKQSKQSKGKKIIIWLVRIIVGLAIILFLSFQIWLSKWNTYTSNDFGFSFKYPDDWYVVGDLPSKIDFDKDNYPHGDFGGIIFNVDSQKNIYKNHGKYSPSPGDVEISFYKINPKLGLANNRPIYCQETKMLGAGFSCGNNSFRSRYLYIETNLYVFELTSPFNSNNVKYIIDQWIGVKIINSFRLK